MANETRQLKTVDGVNVNPIAPELWNDLLEYGGALTVNEKTNKLSVELNPGFPIYYESGSGGLDINTDSTLTKIYYENDKGELLSTDLSVAVPVPDPTDVEAPATNGDVLTYDSDSDKIVWAAPQGGGSNLPSTTTANAGDVLTLDEDKNLSWSAPQGGGSSTSIIYLNTNTMTATLNGNPITPGEVMELVKTNPYIVLRKCWNYQGVTYYGYDNYYVANYLNGEQQLLYFVCQDFGSGDTVYTDAVRANNCDPSNPIWEIV